MLAVLCAARPSLPFSVYGSSLHVGEDELPRAYYSVVPRAHVPHFHVMEGSVHTWSDFASEVGEAHRVHPHLLEP